MTTTTKPVVELKRGKGADGLMYRVVMWAAIPGEERPVMFNVDYSFVFQYGSDAGRHVLYVDAPDPEEFGYPTHPEYCLKGDNEKVDREWRKYNRLAVEIMKAFAFPHLKEAMTALGINWLPDASEYKFSRKAGCSCGCSPGFTARGVRRGLFVYVNVQRAR